MNLRLVPFLCLLPCSALLAEPVIYSFNPTGGKPGDTFRVTGAKLEETKLLFVGGYGSVFTLDKDLSLIVTVPEAAVTGPVVIYAADSVVQSKENFVVFGPADPPEIASIDPASGSEGSSVSITGSNLLSTTSVTIGGAVAEYMVSGNLRIIATVPAKAQSGQIVVTTPIGTAKSPTSFTVVPPRLLPAVLSFKPGSGPPGTAVDIYGSNLSGMKQVAFNGVPADFKQINETAVQATVPPGAASGPVSVQTAEGTATSRDDFIVPTPLLPPGIESFSTWRANVGDKLRIRGSGFKGVQSVSFGGVASSFTVLSASEIEAVIPKGAVSAPVIIVTDGGKGMSSSPFVISSLNDPPPKAPALQAIASPKSGQFQLDFLTEAYHPYVVEFSDSLSVAGAGSWQQLGVEPPHTTTAQSTVFADSLAAGSRFFRVTADRWSIENWDFESGLYGWTATGDAFLNQPVFGLCYLKERTESSGLVNDIGGDYWNVRVHLGHHGDSWIGTGQNHPAPDSPIVTDPTTLDARTGTLTSANFRLIQPWLTFLIGGGFSGPHSAEETPHVALDVAPNSSLERTLWGLLYTPVDHGFFRITRAWVVDSDKEMMRREVLDVSALSNHIARICIIDNSTKGHINADDFRFPSNDPSPELIPVGSIYRDPDAPVWGFADTHTHPKANLGFGGKLISGFSEGSPQAALGSCEANHGVGGEALCFPLALCAPAILMLELVSPCGHRTGGYEYGFDGWPNVLEQGVHQQMYVEWVRRAWQGGLRLMVAHAVHARILADLYFSTSDDKSDIAVAEAQIQAIKQMVSRNSDFMEVALTPRDARRIIHNGKLAVVLGIEVDRPFLTPDATSVSDSAIINAVDDAYTRLGVRHMFMIHLGNNPYGGYAMYNPLWVYNNWWIDHQNYPVADNPVALGVPDPLEWRFEAQGLLQVGGFILGVAAFPPAPIYPAGPNINVRTLQPSGSTFLRAMMNHGMLIDIDHMGIMTKNGVFDAAEAQSYPLISGHSGFTELALRGTETSDMGKRAAESDLTPTLIGRLQALNGMVSPITIAKDLRPWGDKVANDLPGSAKSWAQCYLYAVEKMGGANVGLGTDYGLVHGSGPRFGMKAAFVLKDDDARKALRPDYLRNQHNGVRYAEPIRDYREPRFQGPNEGDPRDTAQGASYDSEQKEYWEATALYQSGANPDTVSYPRPRTDKIKYVSRGMRAHNDTELAAALVDLPFIPGDAPHEVRAGYYVSNDLTPRPGDDVRVSEIYAKLHPVWLKWQDMQGNNVPLHRCTMNCIVEANTSRPFVKDWDINLDGMAHYGLLPDFIQDLKNCGLTRDDLQPLFNSAEDYIRLWERCERARRTGP